MTLGNRGGSANRLWRFYKFVGFSALVGAVMFASWVVHRHISQHNSLVGLTLYHFNPAPVLQSVWGYMNDTIQTVRKMLQRPEPEIPRAIELKQMPKPQNQTNDTTL